MKKIVFIILLIQSLSVAAQIRISEFKPSYSDGAAADIRTAVVDPDGMLCAVLKLETKLSGWTFDAGFAGIMDTRFGDGVIWIYIPASARKLTVAHKEYGVLREWPFPVSLEPGRTYTMRLSYERPAPSSKARSAAPQIPSSRSAAPATTYRPEAGRGNPLTLSSERGEKAFCNHFADFYMGFPMSKDFDNHYLMNEDLWYGLGYTWIGRRVGPYMTVGTNFDDCFSVIGGAAYRLTNPDAASLDWQVYGGAGLLGGTFGVDVGTRFAWRSSHTLSHWDFGFGCQFTKDTIMPTVSVGLYIWGIPAVICIGLVACSIGG